MTWKPLCTALAILAMVGCLEREYENPFVTGNDSGIDEAWKHDGDGNGIADSVQVYSPNCAGTPAECLSRARAESERISAQAGKTGNDTVPPPRDTAADPDPDPGPKPVPDPKTDSVPPPKPDPIQSDSIPVPVPPSRDTVRDTVIVTVPSVAVTGIEAEAIYIPMGAAGATPSISVLPRNAGNQAYTLTSGNEGIVKVSGRTLVPVKPGTASIRARSEDGGFTADFDATVFLKDSNVYEESVSAADMELTEGDGPKAPSITWIPAKVTNRGYALTSPDPSKVLVVVDGGVQKCKPVAPGTVTMTLKTQGKGLTATFKVVVKAAPLLTIPVINIKAGSMTLELGAKAQVPKVTYTPSLATNKAYTLTSDKPGIVSVSGTGLNAVAAGKATVTITSADGPFSAFDVTVRASVDSISAPDLTLAVGEIQVVQVAFKPATAENKRFTLSSDSTNKVAIQGTSIIGVKNGKATITVTAEDGGATTTFEVMVKKKAE